MELIVETKAVNKEYYLGKTIVKALDNINLSIKKGDFTAIAGPSGSGKTTLLNLIGCVDVPSQGEVIIAGQKTSGMSDKNLTRLRLFKLGFIFQSFNLIPVLNISQNVEFPLLLQGILTAKERARRVDELIEKVGLTEFAHHRSNELSGGQRQRVAIARALVSQPEIVLADEPTANLDSQTGHNIIELMREINRTSHTTFIFSTHDKRVMDQADKILLMQDGKLQTSA